MLKDEWFQRADDALEFARAGFAASGIAGFACFLAHQSAELALKGFLVRAGEEPPRVHDLPRLIALCRGCDPTFGGSDADALLLNPWYIPARYPVPITMSATAEDARQALGAAERLLRAASMERG